MRVSTCVGNYAEIPYSVPGLEINVYSVEELCYCLIYFVNFCLSYC